LVWNSVTISVFFVYGRQHILPLFPELPPRRKP
jgi:hypothetical protein